MHPNDTDSFWARVDRSGECWLWTGALSNPNGYGEFGYFGKKFRTHRYVYELTYGPIPNGMWVLHHCDNPPCVRPDHLFLGTRADNIRDQWSKGRGVIPPPVRKLTPDMIRTIHALHAQGWSLRRIGDAIGTSKIPVQNVIHGRTYLK